MKHDIGNKMIRNWLSSDWSWVFANPSVYAQHLLYENDCNFSPQENLSFGNAS